MNKHQMEIGANKTGIATATELAAQMVSGTREFAPSSPGDEQEIARVRGMYSETAEPLGTVPPIAETGSKEAPSEQAVLTELLDKLGARLSFERSGVRLYTALINKLEAYGSFTGGPERTDLERIRDQELEHFHLLGQAIEELGGDPTCVTPSADLQATMSKGVVDVLVDPRTNFVQGLEAILVAELVDRDSWAMLAELAELAGQRELRDQCQEAEVHEVDHRERVRGWLAKAVESFS